MLFSKQKTRYQSEATLFIEGLKKADPHLEQKQLAGRALLWDKAPLSLDAQKRILDSTITSEKP
jgi:hypothetical protein